MQAAYAVLIDNMRVCITCKLPSELIPDMQACAACKLSRAPIPDVQGFCRWDLCIHCFLLFIIWRYCLDFLLSAIWSTLHVYIPFHGNHSTLSSPSYSRPNLCFHYVKEMCRTMTLVPSCSYKCPAICPQFSFVLQLFVLLLIIIIVNILLQQNSTMSSLATAM